MGVFLRKYATATHIYIPIIKRAVVDYAVGADWTPAAGDVKVVIDGTVSGNIGTLPTAITSGNTALWDFTLTTGETTGKKIQITVADSATKAVEDQTIEIETYGHASAEYQADLSAANLPANVIQAAGTAWGSGAITAASIASDAITSAKIADNAITAAKLAADCITAAKIATDAIDADCLKADAVTEIQTGLATSANVTSILSAIDAVDNFIDTEVAAIIAAIGTPSNLGSGATLAANLVDIEAQTDDIGVAGLGLTAIPWNAAWDAEVQSEVTDALTVALTEGYRSTNATGSVRDLLYEINQHLGESSIAGTTKTLKKIDGSTTAKTFTLNHATTPTAITETT